MRTHTHGYRHILLLMTWICFPVYISTNISFPAVPGGLVEGDVRINGYPLDADALRRVVGYVEQVDALDPFSTVQEAVRHAARTTLPREIALSIVDQHVEQVYMSLCGFCAFPMCVYVYISVCLRRRYATVQFVHTHTHTSSFTHTHVPIHLAHTLALQVMRLTDLSALADARIGIPLERGLSQEQRRRVSIACQLATNPSLLFVGRTVVLFNAIMIHVFPYFCFLYSCGCLWSFKHVHSLASCVCYCHYL